ncbi:MAG: hypothetical protein LBU82_01685, partial [Treponema sp.]|nr:hypothetical protein [Treponema sp.]
MPKIFKLICTHRLHLFFLAVALFFLACKTAPKRTPVSSGGGTGERIEGRQLSGSVSEEIRRLIETGRLSSMIHAMDLIQDRGLGGIEFGRVMNGIITIFVRQLYPDSGIQLLPLDLPQTNYYARIIREAEKGNYVPPPENSTDFFEYVLPFFSVNDNTASDILSKIIKDLEKAGGMQPLSVLPPYFQGLIYERTGQFENAVALYAAAYKISDECYS